MTWPSAAASSISTTVVLDGFAGSHSVAPVDGDPLPADRVVGPSAVVPRISSLVLVGGDDQLTRGGTSPQVASSGADPRPRASGLRTSSVVTWRGRFCVRIPSFIQWINYGQVHDLLDQPESGSGRARHRCLANASVTCPHPPRVGSLAGAIGAPLPLSCDSDDGVAADGGDEHGRRCFVPMRAQRVRGLRQRHALLVRAGRRVSAVRARTAQ